MSKGQVIGSAYLQVIPKLALGNVKKESAIAGNVSGDSFMDSFGKMLGGAGGAAKTAMKAVTIAAGAAAAAVGFVGKQSFDAYANYEQLSGGMQKLFGDAASTVMANADKAFMTAGKSANKYMEGVTAFSATLVKSVGGDTAEAARLADVAMTAMADNVNTFGTSAESVQAAIQGISRGNYSMLDNLSLGFAGTQQGMLDLINASGVLDHELTKTSELADVGFGTMIEAIQKVQEDMGIAGTTAKEAMGTIEGSITAAQSAWENVLTAIGTGDSERLTSAASGLVDAVFGVVSEESGKREGGVIANIMGFVQRSFQAISGALPGMVDGVLSMLPDEIERPLRGIIDRISGLFGKADVGGKLSAAFRAAAPVVVSAIGNILSAVNKAYDVITTQVLPVAKSVYDTIAPVVQSIWSEIQSYFPQIQATIQTAMSAVGDLIADVWPVISETVQTASELVASAIETAWPVVRDVVSSVMGGIKSVVETVWPIITKVIKTAVGLIKSAINGIAPLASKVKSTFTKIRDAVTGPINTAKEAVSNAIERIKSIINGAHISLPHFKLPHFRIDGGELPWGIGGKGHAPSISVDWYAKGGFVDQPTLAVGMGERGGEFIWPSYAPYLDKYADALASRINGGGGVNVYLTYNGSGDADDLVRTLTRDLRMMRMTGAI